MKRPGICAMLFAITPDVIICALEPNWYFLITELDDDKLKEIDV
jgi:hypothetical protein